MTKRGARTPDVVVLGVATRRCLGGRRVPRHPTSGCPARGSSCSCPVADDELVTASILAGASGVLLQGISGDALLAAIESVAGGASLTRPDRDVACARLAARRRSPDGGSRLPALCAGAARARSDRGGKDEPRDRVRARAEREDREELRQQHPQQARRCIDARRPPRLSRGNLRTTSDAADRRSATVRAGGSGKRNCAHRSRPIRRVPPLRGDAHVAR